MPGELDYTIYFDDNLQTVYACATWYVYDYGRRHQAVCGPAGTPSEVVRVHSGLCQKHVKWVAEALGGQPQAPSHDTMSANEILIDKVIGVATPGVVLSGDQTWVLSGEYVYALLVMPSDSDLLTGGGCPTDQSSASGNVANPTLFKQFLGPAAPVSSNGPWGQISGGPDTAGNGPNGQILFGKAT